MKKLLLALMLALPLAAQSLPVPLPVQLPEPKYTPAWLATAGGGTVTKGKSSEFGYWSVSRFLGQKTYATMVTEYTISNRQVVTCSMAGITKDMYELGLVSAGVTGVGGVCSGSTQGATGAASPQAFLNFHLGKNSRFNIPITARKTFTPNGDTALKVSIGLGISW